MCIQDLHPAKFAPISVIFFHDGQSAKYTGVKLWGLVAGEPLSTAQQLEWQITGERSVQEGEWVMVKVLGEVKGRCKSPSSPNNSGLLQVDTETLDFNPLIIAS